MRRDLADADRLQAVRDAARGWKRTGLIDPETQAAVQRLYPDDRRRLGSVLRIVAYAFTLFAAGAGFALLVLTTDVHRHDGLGATMTLLYGCGLWVVAELLSGKGRLRAAGLDGALMLAGGLFLLGGSAWFLGGVWDLDERHVIPAVLGLSLLVFGAAAYRWGSVVCAALSSVSLGLLLAQAPHARLSWIAVSLLVIPIAVRASESGRLVPSHRRCAGALLVVAAAGLYLALHLGSWDERLIERELHLVSGSAAAPTFLPRLGIVLATALLPVVLLAFGLATRRRLLWVLGLLAAVASLVTLRVYVHVAPLWVILSGTGMALLVAALAVRRWLEGGAGHERGGFTARPLFDDDTRRRLAENVVAVAVATPEAPAQNERAGFEGGGGRSGGGGASGDY